MVAMGFGKELLKAHKQMGNSWSRVDLCLYYSWSHWWVYGLVKLDWYQFVVGNKNDVEAQCKKMLEKFDFTEEYEIKWYVRWTLVHHLAER